MATDTKSILSVVARQCELPPAGTPVEEARPVEEAPPIPTFTVSMEPRGRNLREALAVVLKRVPSRDRVNSVKSVCVGDLMRFSPPRRAFFTAAMLHFSVVFFLIRVPMSLLFGQPAPRIQRRTNVPLIYHLQTVSLSHSLPSPRMPGPGGVPGHGPNPNQPPARGSEAFHPKMTIVSNPAHPNNRRQTISQLSSPPDLRMQAQPRLPNIVVSSPIWSPKFPTTVALSAPVRAASDEKPSDLQIPTLPYSTADLPFPLVPSENSQPKLPVFPSSSLSASKPQRAANSDVAGLGGTDKTQGDAPGLLVVGVDPAGLKDLVAMLPGNRSGAFPISPAGGQPGSPGGAPGTHSGGMGDAGPGGDPSTGVGPGKTGGGGGGGGGSMLGGSLSINGGAGSGSGANDDAFVYSDSGSVVVPLASAGAVFPINPLIVSAGPLGGGGLDVYAVLQCHKIYTVYLPMPGKNWILQYCTPDTLVASEEPKARGSVVRMEPGLVPPVTARRFDFLRPPVPKDVKNDVVVLRGVIGEDGSISQLRVQRGVTEAADQGALAAFARWQFRPALRAAKPVAVDFLVGIPAILGTK